MKKILLTLLICSTFGLGAQEKYLHCGKLIDIENGKILKEKTVVVAGKKIKSILDGYAIPKNQEDEVIDLKDKTVLPGLIDMHVHIEFESNPKTYLERFTQSDAHTAINSTVYAKKTLMAGFTAVRDLGGTGVNIALKQAINKGIVPGPRIFTAGKTIATTGGHGDPTNGMRKEFMADPGPKDGVINSPEDARKAVRQRYKEGADVIKITATGGVLSVAKSGKNPQFTVEEIEAVTQTAHDYGMLTAAHAHGDAGMQRAVKGGIKTIEHGTFMSETTMELMKQFKSYLVPTITAGKEVAAKAQIQNYYPEMVAQKAREVGPQIQNTFSKAYKKGVPIAFGTDAGVFPHGLNGKEFAFMHEAGMPVIETIKSATITNAALLGEAENLGKIEAGYLADIIAVNENPVEKVDTLENVVFVMKDGVVYKNF